MIYPSLFNRLSMRMNQGWIRGGMTGLRVASQRKRDIAERMPFFLRALACYRRQKKTTSWDVVSAFGYGLAVNVCTVSQFFARLKMGNVFTFQFHFIARFRVTTRTRCAVMQRKAAESPDFNAFALGQRCGHVLQHLFYSILNDFRRNMSLLASKSFNQF